MFLDSQMRLRVPLNAFVLAATGLVSLGYVDGASANQLEIEATMPGDPSWGTTAPCKDSQFVVAGNDNRNMLLSRHTYCAKYVTEWQSVYMDVMKTADGKSYEPYKKSAGRSPEVCTLGAIKLTTQYQAYGKGTTLVAPHKIKVTVAKFDKASRSPNCPVQSSSIAVTPVMETGEINWTPGTTNIKINHTAPKLAMQLATGNAAAANVDGTVTWNSTETKSMVWVSFRPTVYNYRVEGAEPADGVERFLQPGGAAGPVHSPVLRCDKNMLKKNNQGCVFPEAAPVFVIDSAKWPQVANHVKTAMTGVTGLTPEMSGPAPGGFALVEGTRAIGLSGSESIPMQRASDADIEKNRANSCELKSSIVGERKTASNKAYTSSQCVGSKVGAPVDGCSCDEYPFASTLSGGYFSRGNTSAKFVDATQNSAAGRELGNVFYQTERVMRQADDSNEQFWVIVK